MLKSIIKVGVAISKHINEVLAECRRHLLEGIVRMRFDMSKSTKSVSTVESLNIVQVLVSDKKIEYLAIFKDPFGSDGLGNDDQATLNWKTNQQLRNRFVVRFGYRFQHWILQ